MIDLRLMVRLNEKENIKKINCTSKENVLFNVILNEYMPIEIVYENYLNLMNKGNDKLVYWNNEYDEFCQLLNKFKKNKIIQFDNLNF